MSIQKLFCAALGLTLRLCFAVVAAIFYRSALRHAENRTQREARVILAAAIAARGYSDQLRLLPLALEPVELLALPRSTEQPAPA